MIEDQGRTLSDWSDPTDSSDLPPPVPLGEDWDTGMME